MSRDETVKFYTTDEYKQRLKDQAEASNQSLSEYCHEVLAAHLDEEQDRQQYSRYGVDQQIELVINEFRDEASSQLTEFKSTTGGKLELIQRLRTVYMIAMWRLIKEDYSPARQEAAMKHAVDHAGLVPSVDPEIESVMPSSNVQPHALESDHPTDTQSATTEDSQ